MVMVSKFSNFPDELTENDELREFELSGSDCIVLNYRPISLLITTSKVLEKITHKRVYSYLEWNNILYNSQYRFRTYHNCEQAIMELVSRLLHAKERVEHSVGIFFRSLGSI